MKNIKENLSTIIAILSALCGFLIVISGAGLHFPAWVIIICGSAPSFFTTVIGILTGRNPDGTTKTPRQVDNLNNEAAATKDIK